MRPLLPSPRKEEEERVSSGLDVARALYHHRSSLPTATLAILVYCDIILSRYRSCPNLSSRYRAELVKRMQQSKCFRCGEIGHWSWDCPFPVGHLKKPITSFSSSANPPQTIVSTYSGRNLYAFHIRRANGACDYILSEDERLDNKITVPIQQISQNRDYELGEGSDLIADDSKEMRGMQMSDMVVSVGLHEGDNAVAEPEGDPSSFVDFSESEDADEDDLQEIVNSGEWDAVEKKTLQSFSWSTTSKIGIFPSFDKIVVPKEAITVNNSGKCNQLSITNFNEHGQLSSNGCGRYETSRDLAGDTLIVSQGSERKPMSKAERKRQMVLVTQQELLRDLEFLLLQHDHESMRVCAEDTFALLDDLSVDYKKFSEHVWDLIDNISAVVDIKSMENCLTLEELSRCIDEERVKLVQIKEEFFAAEALLKESNQNEERIREEVSRLEAMLQEERNKMKYCELERLEIEIRLGGLNRKLAEVDTTLKGRVEEAELTRRLNQERQTKKMAAMVALEKAKRVVEN